VKELLKGGYEQKKIRQVMKFIQFFVNFGKEESVKEFESELSKIIKTRTNMGIEQTIIEHFKEEGRLEGIQKGIQKGRLEGKQEGRLEGKQEGEYQKAIKTAKNCLKEGMSVELVAKITELPLKVIQELVQSQINP
jgi:predicted transposase YdaD